MTSIRKRQHADIVRRDLSNGTSSTGELEREVHLLVDLKLERILHGSERACGGLSNCANRAVRGLVVEDFETRDVREIAEAVDCRAVNDAGGGSGGSIALLVAVDDDTERLIGFGSSSRSVHDDDAFEHDGLENAFAADTSGFSSVLRNEIERRIEDYASGSSSSEGAGCVEELEFTTFRRIATVVARYISSQWLDKAIYENTSNGSLPRLRKPAPAPYATPCMAS